MGRDNSRLIGPWPSLLQPYLSRADSPLDLSGLGTTSYLEDFEDHALNVPGVTANHGGPASITFGPGLHDSVDADDGDDRRSGLQRRRFLLGNGSDGRYLHLRRHGARRSAHVRGRRLDGRTARTHDV